MTKFAIILLLIRFACVYGNFEDIYSNFKVRVNSDSHKKAAQGVLTRLLGSKAEIFDFSIENVEVKRDYFQLFKSENGDKVSVSGPNGLSLVWGAHYYLKNYLNCHVSWDGDQLNIPDVLPFVNITIQSVDKVRYYQNACTSSYSFVWWDWKRWEREIDWMALNGINLALAFTAQEAIWQRVYDGLGLAKNDFTGPAFLAWNRMGNLRNFGGGLNSNWHKDQVALQHKILDRMRTLGIIPVLPAFCGMVPTSFNHSYPLSNLTKMSEWSRFKDHNCCPFLLSPSDGFFPIISRVFMTEYITEFGTDHIYSCDTFNENTPPSGKPEYLSEISRTIYSEITQVDPGAVWMIQGWMFIDPFWVDKNRVKTFLGSVPTGKMLVLDLQSGLTPQYPRLESYYGQPFIWCTLLSFGGQLGMYGYLEKVNKEVLAGRTFKNSTMIGVGITPEGIDQNYLMYEFTLESALRTEPANLSDWVSSYALRRYGAFNKDVNDGWIILKDTAYNYKPEALFRKSISGNAPAKLLHGEHIFKNVLTKLPSLKLNILLWYNRSKIFDVFEKFLSASEDEEMSSSKLFRHDLVDVTRQTIQFAFSGLYFKLLSEYALVDLDNFQDTSATLLNILDELDKVLGTGDKFLLGKWLESAKSRATNDIEIAEYEFNARNQITLWGPHGEIRDYAAKQWSGLVRDYYKPRWAVFVDALNLSLTTNVPFNFTATKEKIFSTVEKPFGHKTIIYPHEPQGNTIEVVRDFASRWGAKLREIFENLHADKFEVKSL